jgi:malate/lactate dehydrogenase
LQQLVRLTTDAVVVCAGAGQLGLVDQGVRDARYDRTRLLGSAPEALAGAVRALVALETHGSPRDVSLTVMGIPPGQIVIPWDQATIGGLSATRVLDEPARRRLAARVAPLWPPGPLALAAAATQVVAALLGQSRRQASVFLAPDASLGKRTRAIALPVTLGPGGVEGAALPALSTHDRVALENAMLL